MCTQHALTRAVGIYGRDVLAAAVDHRGLQLLALRAITRQRHAVRYTGGLRQYRAAQVGRALEERPSTLDGGCSAGVAVTAGLACEPRARGP